MQHQDIDWNQIVFTDESSFLMQHVYGEKYYVTTVKYSADLPNPNLQNQEFIRRKQQILILEPET